jgi:peptide chain release factor subunit 1
MVMSSKERFKLKKMLKGLSKNRARHTELISVYIPSGYDINKVKQQLTGEAGTARNIKSSGTRKNVQDALEKMIRALGHYKQTPPNGLAIFSGNVAEREGQSDVQLWEIEPPTPLRTKIYRCDQSFFLEPLQEFVSIRESYGLVVIDRQEGNIGVLKGKAIIPIKSFDSIVPGDTKAGGQSAARFSRVRDGMLKDFFKQVGSAVNKQFLGDKEIKGILIGGPGPNKDMFVTGNFLLTPIKDKILGVLDTGYTGRQGLEELVSKSEDILSEEEVTKERKAVTKFFDVLATRSNFVVYGEAEVQNAINVGAVDMLLISEDIEEDKIDLMAQSCEEFGGEWIVVSSDSKEGAQFKNFGGIGAILRYPVAN